MTTIMIVDDEKMILECIGESLACMFNYNVITANCGTEAINKYKDQWPNIDLVILDMLMPDMHGCEVFKYLKEINPNIKVIVMSGYCTNEDKVKMHAFGCTFLQKPVMPREIDRHIKKVLGVANEIGQK